MTNDAQAMKAGPENNLCSGPQKNKKNRGGVWNPSALRGMPKPGTDAELEILSEWYFGLALHFKKLWGFSMSVQESWDEMSGGSGAIDDYNSSDAFWKHVMGGPLSCGGIAGSCYGSYNVNGYRNKKRLADWVSSRRRGDSSSVRPAFVRLAEQLRSSEGTPRIRNRGVLTSGREDGALAASLSEVSA